jgi:lipopolysaccharide/colanic/teichoic acid biosynthesis glycosyltransferase
VRRSAPPQQQIGRRFEDFECGGSWPCRCPRDKSPDLIGSYRVERATLWVGAIKVVLANGDFRVVSPTNHESNDEIQNHAAPRPSQDASASVKTAGSSFRGFRECTGLTRPFQRVAKRAFDIITATTALVLFSPTLLLASLAIKLDSRGPVFCTQIRHGYNNQPIPVLKFRSTISISVTEKTTCLTRVGRLLRQTGADGLPMLINVLRGEMSIVGPGFYVTPPRMMLEEPILQIVWRNKMKPGLTGWAQVNGFQGAFLQRRCGGTTYSILPIGPSSSTRRSFSGPFFPKRHMQSPSELMLWRSIPYVSQVGERRDHQAFLLAADDFQFD